MTTDPEKTVNQYMIRQNVEALKLWVEGFLRDCRVRDLSPFTIEYYRAQLAHFETYPQAHNVTQVPEITADLLREYLLELKAKGHNPGGRHAKYRAVAIFHLVNKYGKQIGKPGLAPMTYTDLCIARL